jgi:hypothetical protein
MLDGPIYAIGGSGGATDLKTVQEVDDPSRHTHLVEFLPGAAARSCRHHCWAALRSCARSQR